ncbi:hypothetical protein Mpal_2301 [Methanosphaerula palustris E1-9c]|uniref:Uncharacterized protein n=1 Tax=Methanosphaerula palustris (strain ATCC BAA-1556 / DSM 19958 / E1-9c) TaxID=521011 RepID=B8GE85_METPE|nr:hypothetical protein Mpal_2301 [Methanosphaerula palustris E1-9c]
MVPVVMSLNWIKQKYRGKRRHVHSRYSDLSVLTSIFEGTTELNRRFGITQNRYK